MELIFGQEEEIIDSESWHIFLSKNQVQMQSGFLHTVEEAAGLVLILFMLALCQRQGRYSSVTVEPVRRKLGQFLHTDSNEGTIWEYHI